MNPNRTITAITATATILLAGACANTYPETGTVQSKEVDRDCKTSKKKPVTTDCTTEYEINIVQDDGTKVEIKAYSRQDFDRCQIGERFPQCTDGKPQ